MSTIKRIAKNAGVTFIGDNLLKILSTILVIFIARYLGDVEYGKFAFALSFTGLFFILMDLGTRILIVREIAQNRKEASKIVANVLMLKFLSSIFVYVLILVSAYGLKYNTETIIAIAIAAAGLVFDSLSMTVGSIFQAFERLEIPAIMRTIRIAVRLAVTLPLLISGSNFLTILLVYAAVQFLDFMVSMFICYKRFVALAFDFDKKLILQLLKKSFPFLLSGIFVTVYFRIDITLMSKLAPASLLGIYDSVSRDAVIGWYSSAYNLLDAATSIAVAVSASILPVAVVYFHESKEKLLKLYSLSIRFLTYLSIPIAVGTTLLADKIILLLYGSAYANAALALRILVWTLIPLCINYIMGATMIAIHKEKEGMYILFLNAVVNIILNLLLIPKYSLYGAAIATVLTEIFYFSGYYYIMSRHIGKIDVLSLVLKPLIASLIMGMVIYYSINLNVIVLVALGALVYSACMYMLKAVNEEEMALIRKIFIEKKQ